MPTSLALYTNTICYNMLKAYLANVVICRCFLYNLCKFVLDSCHTVYLCTRNSTRSNAKLYVSLAMLLCIDIHIPNIQNSNEMDIHT